MSTPATVRHILVAPGSMNPIGIVYDSALPPGAVSRVLRQCQNCVRLFVADLGTDDRFCSGCRSCHLSPAAAMRWSQVRQLQAIRSNWVEREMHVKPERPRVTEPLTDRLVAAFKVAEDGCLCATELIRLTSSSNSNVAVARARMAGVWVVPIGFRKVKAGRPRRIYAISD